MKRCRNQKDGEEHVNSTLHTGNELNISIKQFSWGTEDDTSMLEKQETAQQELVYITNLKDDLQNNSTKMNEEKHPKDKKPAAKKSPFERTSLVNLNHGSKMYEEPGSENENIEESEKGENEKNTKESTYTNIGSYVRGK